VDLLETPDGPVVLEVNRLPAMDNYTATAYVNAIRRHVAGRKVAKLPMARRTNDLYEGVLVV
jgi:glutathione synthase/RimK-type ligase-like ATP-grasp enzyme